MKKSIKGALLMTAGLTLLANLASCGQQFTDKDFIYNTYITTKPSTWNVHDWETNDESYISSFTEIGLYDVILDESKTKYEFVTEMASEFPYKVTTEDLEDYSEYQTIKDNYYNGINPAEGMIWDIKLNKKACWEDGTPIKAVDYVESMKRQLSPEYVNFRADSYYASTFVIANAERYFKSGRKTLEPIYTLINPENYEFKKPEDAESVGSTYYMNFGKIAPFAATVGYANASEITLYQLLNEFTSQGTQQVRDASRRIIESAQYYLFHYLDKDKKANSDEHESWSKAKTPSDVKSEMMNYDIKTVDYDLKEVKVRKSTSSSWDNANDLEKYSSSKLYEDMRTFVENFTKKRHNKSHLALLSGYIKNEVFSDFNKVGIIAKDEYTIRLFLGKTIKLLDLKFALASNWLVKTDLYDRLSTTVNNITSTAYATKTVKNYQSYGPYKLTKYEEGKSFFISKNEKWYGYTDGNHVGQFQMTGISTEVIQEHQTAVKKFEQGKLDDITLDVNDMETYSSSSRLQTTPESYTQKISLNSNADKLKSRQGEKTGVNKLILANKDFRKGLSLALNRRGFAANTAGSQPFTGLLNNLYLTDVEIGEMYQSTRQAKGIYKDVYGELGGDPYSQGYQVSALEERDYGYNFAQATYYVEKALKDEFDNDRIFNNDVITVEMQVYDNESDTTVKMTNFIKDAFTSVIAAGVAKYNANNNKNVNIGFKLDVIKNEDYYNSAKSGNYDMIFSIWGGAAINPYGLMQVYCDKDFESTCEFGFRGRQDYEQFAIDFDNDEDGVVEETETKSFYKWYLDITNNIQEPDLETVDRTIPYEEQTEADQKKLDDYKVIHNKRVTILARLEAEIIKRFEAIPLVARGSSSLYSLKINYATTNYVNLIGYGGVRFMTFNWNEKAWQAFIKSKDYDPFIYRS